jgi:hypothetical protein
VAFSAVVAVLALAAGLTWAGVRSLEAAGGSPGAGGSGGARAAAAAARTWYVSRTSAGGDGSTWATAWHELADINWFVVGPGDTVEIDGGPDACPSNYDFADHAVRRPGLHCGMEYETPLTIRASGTDGAPVSVRLAGDSDRNGSVVIFGGRTSMLPSCDQQDYAPAFGSRGYANGAGIVVPGSSHVIVDGGHRSGIMVYGNETGIDLASNQTRFVTLRNLEVFDNGVYSEWEHGWRTNNEGISVAGTDIAIERSLVHDNGQDQIQDRATGSANGHTALNDIALRDSWLYNHRDHPQWRGYPFSSGAQYGSDQECTHVDGVQIWGGGLHQERFTVDRTVFGPLLGQGLYLGNLDTASFDDVKVTGSLFINALNHSVMGDRVGADPGTPSGWTIQNITSYQTDEPAPGTADHGGVDLAGSGQTLRDSIFYNGYFSDRRSFSSAEGNLYHRGDPVPGGSDIDPAFVGPLPTSGAPTYAELAAADLTATCDACAGKGSPVGSVKDLLARIDQLNASGD